MKVTISNAQRNPQRQTAEQILAQARALRTEFLMTVTRRVWDWIVVAAAAIRAAQARREARQALSLLDRHTLVDVGLDRMTGDFGMPANENRPRHVA
jgi:uncharacterized protein YjiS (DUF1127 family)